MLSSSPRPIDPLRRLARLATVPRRARRLLGAALLALVVAFAVGCSKDRYAENEANAFYQDGVRFRQEAHYEAATEAFEKCIFYSPGSYKAHLQLAVIYDDHLDDPTRAVVHYRQCLQAPGIDATTRAQAESSLRRAEERLYAQLGSRLYADKKGGGTTATSANRSPGVPDTKSPGPVRPPAMAVTPLGQPPRPGAGNKELESELERAQNPPAAATAPAAPTVIVDEAGRKLLGYHTVVGGDVLTKISKRYYGTSTKWDVIYKANRDTLRSPESLQIGDKLRIPVLDVE